MENKDLVNIGECCFNIHLNFSKVNLDSLINRLINIGDITFLNGSLIIFLNENSDKRLLLSILKKEKIKEFFCETILWEDVMGKNDFLESFIGSRFAARQEFLINKEYQKELQQMNENINKVKEEIEKLIPSQEKEKEGDHANGQHNQ